MGREREGTRRSHTVKRENELLQGGLCRPGWKKLLIGACDDGKPRRSTSSGACQLLEALIARPNAVSRQTRDKDTGGGSRLQRRRTHVPAHYILLARATSKIYGPSVYRRPNETFQESFGLFARCQTISCRPPPTIPFD